jgi:hypothetical protein
MPPINSTDETQDKKASSDDSNDELIHQIREDFRYCKEYWRENHDEAEKDMQCVAAIPPPDFRDDRKGRPCIWPDEVSQYCKQANNNLRQNTRSIKVSPRSEDAKDIDAEHRQAYMRGIEYASKAQSIYTTAYEACTNSAFGFWRINCRVVGSKGEQEPRIVRIPNQFTVYPDPDAQEADFSDSSIYFVLDSMRQATFARRYPKAKKRSFSDADMKIAPDWFSGDNIVVAEAWKRDEIEVKDGEKLYDVTQRITNGLEILETNKWIGSWIPVVGVFGEELYVRTGGESKRMFMSLIRRARGAQQMLAYIASQEAEEFGMAPRAPMQGYKGQFDPEKHKYLHKLPQAYAEFGIPDDWNPSWGPPPLPSRMQFIPNAQAYEIAYERWRRSIQAAVGVTPLPTAAQRQNEKSGIALERIQTQEAVGSFHITDNFVRALGNTGRQINELITKLAELDSLPKQVLGKDQKGDDKILKVAPRTQSGEQDAASEELPEAEYFFAHRGQFEVSISDGPNYQSQREEASDFADTLLKVLPTLGVPPALMQQILSIAVKLKNIGSYGDEIADLLSPPDPSKLPPAAKAILAQAQGQVQMLTQEIQKLQLEKLGKVTETQGKMAIADKEAQTRMAEADKDRETKLAVAEVMTKAQNIQERMSAVEDLMKQLHSQAHEIAMGLQAHNNAKELAAQQAQQQQEAAQQAAALQEAASSTPPGATGGASPASPAQ